MSNLAKPFVLLRLLLWALVGVGGLVAMAVLIVSPAQTSISQQPHRISAGPHATESREAASPAVRPPKPSMPQANPRGETSPATGMPKISLANYEQLKPGMTLADVEQLLGPGSREYPEESYWKNVAPGGQAPGKVFYYWWNGGMLIVVGFTDGQTDWDSMVLHR